MKITFCALIVACLALVGCQEQKEPTADKSKAVEKAPEKAPAPTNAPAK
ncbi:MAG: hypothetical protein HZA90_06650 [Verrucomicrobia bacterium]|nr:hypothetical protein [Verrucomicrobiota bacterium]